MANIHVGKYTFSGASHRELIGIKNEIFNQSIYDFSLSTKDQALGTKLTILDLGAHVGLASLYFHLQYPEAQITAVEPHPTNVTYLRQNLWENNLNNITVIEAALSDRAGEVPLYFDQGESWFSNASLTNQLWDDSIQNDMIKVKTITLDSLLTQSVDLLKLDIEGAEIKVLRAARLLHHVKNLIIELHPPNSVKDIEKIFEKTHNLTIKKHHFGLHLIHATKK